MSSIYVYKLTWQRRIVASILTRQWRQAIAITGILSHIIRLIKWIYNKSGTAYTLPMSACSMQIRWTERVKNAWLSQKGLVFLSFGCDTSLKCEGARDGESLHYRQATEKGVTGSRSLTQILYVVLPIKTLACKRKIWS